VRAVILAAGASRRAGGCKALFPFEGESYLERTIATLRAGGAGEIVVVIARPWRDAILARITALRVRAVENLGAEADMLGSLRVALEALVPREAPLVLALVDHPGVSSATLEALVAASRSLGPDVVVRPRFAGRHGHPVVIGHGVVARLRERQRGPRTLREALAQAGRLVSIDVEDAAILEDRDGPAAPPDEDLAQARPEP
jgi:molybdenum cofactor cytidylyltransferase